MAVFRAIPNQIVFISFIGVMMQEKSTYKKQILRENQISYKL